MIERRSPYAILVCLAFLAATVCPPGPVAQATAAADLWDSGRYIGIEEVKAGMEAHCLTDYGQGVERFDLRVLDVVRGVEAGKDIILVQGTDPRFVHTGPVLGCSGSPVYIDGRMAGALAFTWTFSKDPVYGVTLIRDMLQVGLGGSTTSRKGDSSLRAMAFDFSKPIDPAAVSEAMSSPVPSAHGPMSGTALLPCPLLVSGIGPQAPEQLRPVFEPIGFAVYAGVGGSSSAADARSDLVPGGTLTVPLVTGDISMTVLGTVTEVRGDKVYAFGHNYLGYGRIDLPMATGKVHTVLSNLSISRKLGSAGKIVGALTADESAAIVGRIGATPKMVPLTIRLDRYNDTQEREYRCRVACNETLTAGLIRAALIGAVGHLGPLPPDHAIEYDVTVDLEDGDVVRASNLSTRMGINEVIAESSGAIALLMSNPYKKPDIESVEFDLRIVPETRSAIVWSAHLSDQKVKPGQTVAIDVTLESFMGRRQEHRLHLTVPENLRPGKYTLTVSGASEYERFIRKVLPFRFIAYNYEDLITALNEALGLKRTKLYCTLTLPASGLSLERAELPDLPATKALVLHSGTRVIKALPYPRWIETTVETGHVVVAKEVLSLTVER